MLKILLVVLSLLTSQITNANEFKVIKGTPGYWQIVQDQNNIWWFRNPESKLQFLSGVTSVQPFYDSAISNGRYYVSKDYHGDINSWAKITYLKLIDTGFSSVGAWSHPAIQRYMPYTQDLNIQVSTHNPIGTPEWASEVENIVKERVDPYREDKNLIGYFLDNELPWGSDKELSHQANTYYEVLCKTVRNHDPNHLILGVRHNHEPPKNVLLAAKGRSDVQSVNQYTDGGILWKKMFREMYEVSEQPIMLSEFSFCAKKNRSGNLNQKAWFDQVENQTERGKRYELIVSASIDCSFIVGTEWFSYADESPDGRKRDKEDMNTGIVDIFDIPYIEMITAVRKMSKSANDRHLYSNDKQLSIVWR